MAFVIHNIRCLRLLVTLLGLNTDSGKPVIIPAIAFLGLDQKLLGSSQGIATYCFKSNKSSDGVSGRQNRHWLNRCVESRAKRSESGSSSIVG
jgi:hypothetical protein